MERWVPHDWPAPETYGEEWAHDYDELALDDPEPVSTVVDALARLAGGGPVLDVAAGTGRVAIPLAAAGVDVTATDASAKMLARLREKDPAGRVRCRVEVLPEVSGSGYAVVAILANSLWVLGTAREQKEFLVNAAASLAPGGVVVVEMTMVDPTRWREPRTFTVRGPVIRRTTVFDEVTQRVRHRFHLPAPFRPSPRDVYLRYVTREELLSMAASAGLVPVHLWSTWDGTPHGPDSPRLIAVLRRS